MERQDKSKNVLVKDRDTETSTPLPPGTKAPDFLLNATPDKRVKLSDFRGRALIIAFYPADWSPVCTDELALFNELLPEFKKLNAEIVGISVDSKWCHVAFAREGNIRFPLLADFHPKGEVARAYNAYREKDGVSERALYVIDSEGTIYWSYVSPAGVNPGADGILTALESLAESEESE